MRRKYSMRNIDQNFIIIPQAKKKRKLIELERCGNLNEVYNTFPGIPFVSSIRKELIMNT